jgi:ABC-2 type transport system ATP-binding protein
MIESRKLSKYYHQRCVVHPIDFAVKPGDVLGFLGPNGAGKSTTMKMLTGFLQPSSGSSWISGIHVQEDPIRARRKLGYLPENGPLYEEMTVQEFLNFIAEIRMPQAGKTARWRAMEKALHTCALQEVRHQTIDTLSKGFHQRVGVAQAILHDPDYLILDEPTDGLDPNQKNEIRALLRNMAKDKAIIMSTHILEEVEAVCNRVIILCEGKIVVDETPDALRRRHPNYGGLAMTFEGEPQSTHAKAAVILPSWELSLSGQQLLMRNRQAAPLDASTMTRLSGSGIRIVSLHPLPTPLDEVFSKLTIPANPAS